MLQPVLYYLLKMFQPNNVNVHSIISGLWVRRTTTYPRCDYKVWFQLYQLRGKLQIVTQQVERGNEVTPLD